MDKKSPLNIIVGPREQSETVTQWVYRTLRDAVMNGTVLPGRALTIRELAALLDVSAMPVREALRLLAAENALELLGNRRVIVPEMTAMKFAELCEARIALETHAAARAMPYVDSRRLDELTELDTRIDEAQAAGDLIKITQLNQQFHRTLYLANPHDITQPLIESVWLQLGPFMRLAMANLADHYIADRHKEALSAIAKSDAYALKMAITSDIRDGLAFAADPHLLQSFVTQSRSSTNA